MGKKTQIANLELHAGYTPVNAALVLNGFAKALFVAIDLGYEPSVELSGTETPFPSLRLYAESPATMGAAQNDHKGPELKGCDRCGKRVGYRHFMSYAGGGDDRVLVCGDCAECTDPDCDCRETEGVAS